MQITHRHEQGRRSLALFPSLFLLVSPICMTSAHAAVSAEDARLLCTRWLERAQASFGDAPRRIAGEPEVLSSKQAIDVPLARVFDLSPEGWVVVAGDREASPIVAYSLDGHLDLSSDQGMPALLRERLEQRRRVVEERKAIGAPDWTRGAWRSLESGGDADSDEIEEGGPLLQSAWHQGEPFQDFCPMGTGGRSVVGCVATAGAQILRYYQWPPNGEGSARYLWQGDHSCRGDATPAELEADFSDPYDWEHMPLTTGEQESPEVRAAVAELCYELGVALEMDYGYCSSSTNSQSLTGALISHFRYNPSMESVARVEVSRTRWFEMIRDEIDQSRPLYYAITAHAVVCDGYRRDGALLFYHVNYGWGGARNAWFALDEVPGNDNQWMEFMVRHIAPAGTVIRLEADGTGYYRNLSAAVASALDGETIELSDGVYRGDGNRDLAFGERSLVIRSQSGDPRACVLDAEGSRDEPHGLIAQLPFMPPGITFEGITFRGAWESGPMSKGAINCSAGQVRFRNCIFEDNVAGESGGAVYISEARPEFENCLFRHNRPYGVECFQSAPVFRGCTFVDHDLSSMRVHESDVTLERCTFAFNRAREGDLHVHSLANLDATRCLFVFSDGQAVNARLGRVTLHCSNVYGNASGDWVGGLMGQENADGNLRVDPYFCSRDLGTGDFSVQADSPCAPAAECGGIGAFGVGCQRPTTGTQDATRTSAVAMRFSPLPSRGPTRVQLALATAGHARIELYDAGGRHVRTLFDGAAAAGAQELEWNGRDDAGRPMASGVYLAHLIAPGIERTERLLVIR